MKPLLCLISIFLNYVILTQHLCSSTAQEMVKRDKSESDEECNFFNCRLPLCKCSNPDRPGNIPYDDTPMMVALSFNGVLTSNHAKYIKKIFDPLFKNPNGCPVQGTFFISNTTSGNSVTDYCLVRTLFNNNNEIGVGSYEYNCPYTDCDSQGQYFRKWKEESAEEKIFNQKKNIALNAKINKSFLRGFRTPFLDQRGNVHFKALRKYAFSYDSSVIIRPDDIKRHNGLRLWPHTLDFPPNYTCPTCPTKKTICKDNSNCYLNGLWVVPMHYLNVESKNLCPSLIKHELADNILETKDCFDKNLLNETIIEKQLFENYKIFYTNKAPFVINIELSWFDKYGDMLTKALVNFISELTINNQSQKKISSDVYFVSISRIIEWIEYPAPINVIANKWLWDCVGVNFDYDEECDAIKKLKESAEELEEIKKKNRTQKLELKTEDLFRNGILTTVIIIFICSIIFTILYDKYN